MKIKSLSLSSPKKAGLVSIFLIALLLPTVAWAAISDWQEILGSIVYWILFYPFILIMKLEMWFLPMVAQYSDFVREAKVVSTWMILRDLANMFFIVILLVMSFGTILQIKGYSYKNLLSSILIMAILINFSRSIIGLAVDFAQVIMLTFVAAWKDVQAAKFQSALGLSGVLNLRTSGVEGVGWGDFLSSIFLGGIMMIVAVVIIGAFIALLIGRIVSLWILTILSPLAFLAYAFPSAKKYYNQWSQELSKTLVIGPALAFFLWLTFTITGDGDIANNITAGQDVNGIGNETYVTDGVRRNVAEGVGGKTQATDVKSLLNYTVAIALLMAGLKFASASGVAGAGIAKAGAAKLQGYVSKANKAISNKTVGRVEDIYSNTGFIGSRPVKLASSIGNKWVDDKGNLKMAPEGAGVVRKTLGGQYGRQALNWATMGKAQRLAIESQVNRRQQAKELIKKKTPTALPNEMEEAFYASQVSRVPVLGATFRGDFNTPLYATKLRDNKLTPDNKVPKKKKNETSEETAKREAIIADNQQRAEEREKARTVFQKAGDLKSLKTLEENSADGNTTVEEANKKVKSNGAKALSSLNSGVVTADGSQATEGFKNLMKALMDPNNGVAASELKKAFDGMTKSMQDTVKTALTLMIKEKEKLGLMNKEVHVMQVIAGQKAKSLALNRDSAEVKAVEVASGTVKPKDTAELIRSIVEGVMQNAPDADKPQLGDKDKGLESLLYGVAAKNIKYENLLGDFSDIANFKDESDPQLQIFKKFASQASKTQQRAFFESAGMTNEALEVFVQALRDSNKQVHGVLEEALKKAKGQPTQNKKSAARQDYDENPSDSAEVEEIKEDETPAPAEETKEETAETNSEDSST